MGRKILLHLWRILFFTFLFLHNSPCITTAVLDDPSYDYEETVFTIEQCDREVKLPIVDCASRILHEFPTWNESILTSPNATPIELHLNNNYIPKIAQIRNSTEIGSIYFNHNQISAIDPFAFTFLPNLKRLILTNNIFYEIPVKAFWSHDGSSLPLEILDLSRNRIFSIPDNAFRDLKNLNDFQFGENHVFNLDATSVIALNNLPSLEILNLSENQIEDLPFTLERTLEKLHTLDLSGNKFTKVPEVLQHGKKITTLVFSGNKNVNELNSNSFIGLKNVKMLEINNMKNLVTIRKGTFAPLLSLERFYCSNNSKLKQIEANSFSNDFNGHRNLKQVELKYDGLTTLDEAVFKNITTCEINLEGNKLYCSCGITWLIADNIRTEKNCLYPAPNEETFEEMNITDIDLYCSFEESTSHSLFWATIGILICFLLICLAMILTRRSCQNKPQQVDVVHTRFQYNRQCGKDGNEDFDGKVCTEYRRAV